jgi:hypothetical protein
MIVPQQFKYLAACFDPRGGQEHATPEHWVRSTVEDYLTPEDRKVVKLFLDEHFSGSTTDDDLQKLWRSAGFGFWHTSAEGPRIFLQMIRDAS